MIVKYRANPDLMIELECADIYELFKELSPIQEVMESMTCGKCGGKDIRFVHRVSSDGKKNFDYYEFHCHSPIHRNGKTVPCKAILVLGNNGTSLYPRRYKVENGEPVLDADGNKVWLPDNGWVRWDHQKKEFV